MFKKMGQYIDKWNLKVYAKNYGQRRKGAEERNES